MTARHLADIAAELGTSSFVVSGDLRRDGRWDRATFTLTARGRSWTASDLLGRDGSPIVGPVDLAQIAFDGVTFDTRGSDRAPSAFAVGARASLRGESLGGVA